MTVPVNTYLHKIVEKYRGMVLSSTSLVHSVTRQPVKLADDILSIAAHMSNRLGKIPHYFIAPELMVLTAIKSKEQLSALAEVGACRLPFDEMVVETVADSAQGPINLFMYYSQGATNAEGLVVMGGGILPSGSALPPLWLKVDSVTENGEWHGVHLHNDRSGNNDTWLRNLMAGYTTAILLRHIKGAAHEHKAAPERLNKNRAAKGKEPIPGFTYYYIGAVEDKDGKSHAYTGRSMPVHMRAGHTRRQHYGKGNALVKTVYIQPVLVNFNPGDDVPVPRRVVKMAS